MRKNIIFSALLALVALMSASCTGDNGPVPARDEVLTPVRISAAYSTTRVAYVEDGNSISATWQEGDVLYVCYNGHVNTLTLSEGAGTTTATFTGTVQGTPSATSMLVCYVGDQNSASAVTVNADGSYTYTDGVFLGQDGTLAGAAKCNLYYGSTFYGTGENISCMFSVNIAMLKFTVYAPDGVSAGDEATLTYKSDGTALAQASFAVGANGQNTVYLAVPAGQYTGEQALQYVSGSADESKTLSATKANFVAGQTYSKTINYETIPVGAVSGRFTVNNSDDQVFFANGNLQYKSGTGWRFAEHQWDYTTNWNNGDWVDHLDWSTCTGDFSGNIINASSAVVWFTLSKDEWLYVFNSRETNATVNSTANARYTEATVNTDATAVNGVILFPDGYSGGTPTGVTWGAINAGSDFGTKCTSAGWAALEASGCVFLPCAGHRNGPEFYDVGIDGLYWSKTEYNSDYAYRIGFYANGLNLPVTNNKGLGFSIRLVCSVN